MIKKILKKIKDFFALKYPYKDVIISNLPEAEPRDSNISLDEMIKLISRVPVDLEERQTLSHEQSESKFMFEMFLCLANEIHELKQKPCVITKEQIDSYLRIKK